MEYTEPVKSWKTLLTTWWELKNFPTRCPNFGKSDSHSVHVLLNMAVGEEFPTPVALSAIYWRAVEYCLARGLASIS